MQTNLLRKVVHRLLDAEVTATEILGHDAQSVAGFWKALTTELIAMIPDSEMPALCEMIADFFIPAKGDE